MHSVVRIVNSSNLKKDLTVIHGNEMHSDDADIIGVVMCWHVVCLCEYIYMHARVLHATNGVPIKGAWSERLI